MENDSLPTWYNLRITPMVTPFSVPSQISRDVVQEYFTIAHETAENYFSGEHHIARDYRFLPGAREPSKEKGFYDLRLPVYKNIESLVNLACLLKGEQPIAGFPEIKDRFEIEFLQSTKYLREGGAHFHTFGVRDGGLWLPRIEEADKAARESFVRLKRRHIDRMERLRAEYLVKRAQNLDAPYESV